MSDFKNIKWARAMWSGEVLLPLRNNDLKADVYVFYPSGHRFELPKILRVMLFLGNPCIQFADFPDTIGLDPRCIITKKRNLIQIYNPRANPELPTWAKDWMKENPKWAHGPTPEWTGPTVDWKTMQSRAERFS